MQDLPCRLQGGVKFKFWEPLPDLAFQVKHARFGDVIGNHIPYKEFPVTRGRNGTCCIVCISSCANDR